MEERPINDVSYETFLREEKLMGSRCADCHTLFVPPRSICTECGSFSTSWVSVKGAGVLKAFTCISVGPPLMSREGFSRKRPYCTGVIELDEGPRIVGRIEKVETSKPETIRIGMPLKATYLHRELDGQETTFLAFEPA